MHAIELENVTKTFGDHTAVDGLSLRVPVGSVYGFIGPNGSGKTTTLRMIMNIIHADRGRISVLGEEKYRRRERSTRVSAGGARALSADESRRSAAVFSALKGHTANAGRDRCDGWSGCSLASGPSGRWRRCPRG